MKASSIKQTLGPKSAHSLTSHDQIKIRNGRRFASPSFSSSLVPESPPLKSLERPWRSPCQERLPFWKPLAEALTSFAPMGSRSNEAAKASRPALGGSRMAPG
ncbi:unnamed protein product [Durusdinium trenchii]|uniref:Uncharacterized protein n=1 Tax=Durusdinium trenchii TaxID=1381693 RepID=A0ABP0N872_9DINO